MKYIIVFKHGRFLKAINRSLRGLYSTTSLRNKAKEMTQYEAEEIVEYLNKYHDICFAAKGCSRDELIPGEK